MRAHVGEFDESSHGRLAVEAQNCRRRSRTRPHDRRRTRARSKNESARAHDLRDRVVDLAFEKGVLLLGAGENTIRIAPPLLIDQQQAEFAANVLDECITKVEKEL